MNLMKWLNPKVLYPKIRNKLGGDKQVPQANTEMSLDRWFLRQDVVDQLLSQGGDTPDAAASYADHII